jgi:hypothetical protein
VLRSKVTEEGLKMATDTSGAVRVHLSAAEFMSLKAVDFAPFLAAKIVSEHSEKLLRMRFIASVPGGYEITVAGRNRIGEGS